MTRKDPILVKQLNACLGSAAASFSYSGTATVSWHGGSAPKLWSLYRSARANGFNGRGSYVFDIEISGMPEIPSGQWRHVLKQVLSVCGMNDRSGLTGTAVRCQVDSLSP
jgi:hypothetical protein